MIDRLQPQGPVNLIPVPVFLDLGERYQPRTTIKGKSAQGCDNGLWIYWTLRVYFACGGSLWGDGDEGGVYQ